MRADESAGSFRHLEKALLVIVHAGLTKSFMTEVDSAEIVERFGRKWQTGWRDCGRANGPRGPSGNADDFRMVRYDACQLNQLIRDHHSP